MTLNMKEVALKVLQKNPHHLLMEENKEIPATEKTVFTDVLVFTSDHVGRNFEKLPHSLKRRAHGVIETIDISLIDTNGDEVETIKSSKYNAYDNEESYKKDQVEFKFKSSDDTIIVAAVLRLTNQSNGKTESALMMLSEPHTIESIKNKRDAALFGPIKEQIKKDMDKISMIWGGNNENIFHSEDAVNENINTIKQGCML